MIFFDKFSQLMATKQKDLLSKIKKEKTLPQSTATNALLIDLRLTVLTATFQRSVFVYLTFVFIFCMA